MICFYLFFFGKTRKSSIDRERIVFRNQNLGSNLENGFSECEFVNLVKCSSQYIELAVEKKAFLELLSRTFEWCSTIF